MQVNKNKDKKTLTEIKREPVTRENLEETIKAIFSKCIRKLNASDDKLNKTTKSLEKKLENFRKIKQDITGRMSEYDKKMSSIEETFFILYHNMKKNQFLYANDESAWWSEFVKLKCGKQIEELKKRKAE